MPALECIFLWGTGLQPDELAELATQRPYLRGQGASLEPDSALETGPEVQFTK
jgi:hypothetical protein